MNSTGSVLQTLVDRVRLLTDETGSDRYEDKDLLEEFILPAWVCFWTDISMLDEDPILLASTVSIIAGTDRYILPPIIGDIWALAMNSATTNARTHDWQKRNEWHSAGAGWRIEGNELVFQPKPTTTEDWLLIYRPSGDCLPHVGSGTVVSSTVITLAATPTLGSFDARDNAYVGLFLRTLEAGRVIQERVISAFDAATRQATVRVAFTQSASHLPADGASVSYEVAFRVYQPQIQCLAAAAAMDMGAPGGFSMAKMQKLDHTYGKNLKACRDHFGNLLVRHAKRFERLTYSNPYRNGVDAPVILGTQ